jgi:hypothetical protein
MTNKHVQNSVIVVNLLFLIYFCFVTFVDAFNQSINFNGFFANGSFQLYNPLRRLMAGQLPGHDFQYFHGLGTMYLHVPMFLAFGGDLFASDMSKRLVSPLLFICSNLILLKIIFRKWSITLFLLNVTIYLSATFYPYLIHEGNSLLGVRSTMPIILAAVLIGLNVYLQESRKSLIIIGSMLAMCLFVGIEHGIAAIMGYLVVALLVSNHPFLQRLKSAAVVACSLVASVIIIYVLTSGIFFWEPIKYALIDIPNDQFWFFGSPPTHFLLTFRDFYTSGSIFYAITMDCILIILICFIKPKSSGTLAMLFLLVYGLFSNMGLLSLLDTYYSMPLIRVEVIVIIWLIVSVLPVYLPFILSKIKELSYLALLLSVSLPFISDTPSLLKTLESLTTTNQVQPEKHQGVYYSANWMNQISAAKDILTAQPQLKIWSTYTSILEYETNQFNPDTDYVIHALGPGRREKYLQTFETTKPDIVRTMDSKWGYEEMLRNTNWTMYEDILTNYEAFSSTVTGLLWKKTNDNWDKQVKWDGASDVTNKPSFEIPVTPSAGKHIYSVRVKYNISNPWKWVPLIGKTPRYLLYVRNSMYHAPISLPPYWNEWTFPVIVDGDQKPSVDLQTLSPIPGAGFVVSDISYRELHISENNMKYFIP